MSKFRPFLVLLVSAGVMVALVACKPQPSAPAVTAPAVVDALTDMAEGGAVQADAQLASITQFHARGNEPFWSVRVDGTALTWTTPEMQPGKPLVADRSDDAEGVKLIGSDGDKAFTLDINRTPCQDSMSGQKFEFTATFTYDGEAMTGCASSGL